MESTTLGGGIFSMKIERTGKTISRDATKAYRLLMNDPEVDLNGEIKMAFEGTQLPMKERFDAIAKIRKLGYRAFNIPEFDEDPENGLTEWEIQDFMNHFFMFIEETQKKTETSPTTSPPSGSSGSPLNKEAMAMYGSDFGSTETASNSAGPTG